MGHQASVGLVQLQYIKIGLAGKSEPRERTEGHAADINMSVCNEDVPGLILSWRALGDGPYFIAVKIIFYDKDISITCTQVTRSINIHSIRCQGHGYAIRIAEV